MSVRDEGYSRNTSCGLNLISTYLSFIINSILIILFLLIFFYRTNLVFTLLDFDTHRIIECASDDT